MAIQTASLTAEMSQPTFSYAQAAKGQAPAQQIPQPSTSPAPASVSSKDETTTVSTSVTAPSVASNEDMREPTKHSQAGNESGHQKQESDIETQSSNAATVTPMVPTAKGDSTPARSTPAAAEEKPQRHAGRSSRTTDAESRKGRKGKKGRKEDKDGEADGDKAQEEKEPPKPVILSEAPIPTVNPWLQRKAATAKPAAPVENGKKEESAGAQDGNSTEKLQKKSADLNHASDQAPRRNGPRGSRAENAASLPSVNDASLWPDVKSAAVAADEEKKKNQDKTEQRVDKDGQGQDDAASKNKKKEWVAMPYVPSVNFNTPMPQRSSNKPRGGARGGREAGTTRAAQTSATGATVTSPTAEKTTATGNAKDGQEGSTPTQANSQPSSASKRASVDMSSAKEVRKPTVTDVRKELAAESLASTTTKAENSRAGPNTEHQSQYPAHKFSGSKGYEAPRERGEGQGRGRGGFRGRGSHSGAVNGHGQQAGFANGQYPVHPLSGRPAGPYSPPAHQSGFGNGYGAGSSRGRSNARGGSGSAGYGRVNSNGAVPGPKMGQANAGNVAFDYSMQQYATFPMPQLPVYDPTTIQLVTAQVEYYLSVDNLCKDFFIRKRMDSQGFVPFDLIAGFKRLKELAPDVEFIRIACETSDKIDYIVGDDHVERLRLREKWDRFVLDMAEREEEARNAGPAVWSFQSRHSRTPYGAPPMMPVGYHPATSPGMFNGSFSPDEQMYQQAYMNGAVPYDTGVNGGDVNGQRFAPDANGQLSAAVPEFSPTAPQGPLQPGQQVPFTLEGATTFSDQDVDNLVIVIANGKKGAASSPGAEAPVVNGTVAASETPQTNGVAEEAGRSQ
jgi:la-related protein 1